MLNARTLIIILFSLLIALLAVRGVSLFRQNQKAPTPPPATPVSQEAQAPGEQPAAESAPKSISDAIPLGKRIVSIKVDEVSGITRYLKPGDRVDVIAISDLGGSKMGTIARPVVQNVRIFDVEEGFYKKLLTDKAMRKKKTWTLKLEVSLEQGIRLSSMAEPARLRLLLRNRNDSETPELKPIVFTPEHGSFYADENISDLARNITPGMRAIDLKVDNRTGICGKLKPGDRVDVIMSFKISRFATEEGNPAVGTQGVVQSMRKSSRIVIQNVQVIATDEPVGHPTQTPKPVSMVSVMVTPKQAEKMAVVIDTSKSGIVRLILRHPTDHEHIHTDGELFSDQVLTDKRAFKVIETLKGTRIYPRKFYDNK